MDEQQPPHEQSAGERLAASMEEPKTEGAPPSPASSKQPGGGGVNKYLIIGIVLALLIVGGAVWSTFFSSNEEVVETGVTRDITIRTVANSWSFDPEEVEVDQGDRIHFTVINEDDYDHGFAIDAYGISQRMPARGTIEVEFVATRAGVFPYYCSVSCGSGIVDGEERGHFDQIGRLYVRNLVSDTTDFSEFSDEELKEQARRAAMFDEVVRYLSANLDLDVPKTGIHFDENNAEWLSEAESVTQGTSFLDSLSGAEYQVLYPDTVVPRIWVFVDVATGEVLDTFTTK